MWKGAHHVASILSLLHLELRVSVETCSLGCRIFPALSDVAPHLQMKSLKRVIFFTAKSFGLKTLKLKTDSALQRGICI